MYIPVPFWALALLVVPAVVCCMFVWVRVATAGQCVKGDVVFGDAPCIVQTFVSPISSVPYNMSMHVRSWWHTAAVLHPQLLLPSAVVIDIVKLTHIYLCCAHHFTHAHTCTRDNTHNMHTHIRLLLILYSRFSTRGSAAAPTSTARAASSCYTSISISVGDAMTNCAIQ